MEFILFILIFILVGMTLYWVLPISFLICGIIYASASVFGDSQKQKTLWGLGCCVAFALINFIYLYYFN